jgi:hypothetical protein
MGKSKVISYDGKNQYLMDVLEDNGLLGKYTLILHRMKRGWKAQKSIDTPKNKYSKRIV